MGLGVLLPPALVLGGCTSEIDSKSQAAGGPRGCLHLVGVFKVAVGRV